MDILHFNAMRKTLAALLVAFSLAPYVAMAAFPAQSANLINASNQYFSRASYVDITGDRTAEAWIKWTATVGTGAQSIMGKYDDAAAGGGGTMDWGFRVVKSGSDTLFACSLNNGSYDESNYTDTGDQTIFDLSWHHVAAVYTASSGTCEFFVDGVSQGTGNSTAVTSIRSSTRKFYVGARGTTPSEEFDPEANIVLARVWSEARTSTQLADNDCLILGATTNLVAEYKFDGDATDNSGNGYDLTAVNTPTYESDVPAACATAVSGGNFWQPF